jgi:ABC-type amino acid transport substrate-binding protein
MDAPVALAYVKEHPTVKVVSKTPFTTEPYGIAIQLEATDLQLFVNQALAKMKADGRLAAIFAKYGL